MDQHPAAEDSLDDIKMWKQQKQLELTNQMYIIYSW